MNSWSSKKPSLCVIHSGGVGQSLSSARILSNSSISFLLAKRTAGFSLYICALQSGQQLGSSSAEKQ